MIGLSVVLAVVQAGTVVVPKEALAHPVRVQCPVNQTTTVIFPEPIRQLKGLGRETAALGLSVERTNPQGVILLRPTTHPTTGTIDFRGPTLAIRIILETVSEGPGSEVRLGIEDPATRAPAAAIFDSNPAAASSPQVGSASKVESSAPPGPAKEAGQSVPGGRPPGASVPPGPPRVLDLEGLLRATSVSIDRREGLPGQREMVLVDALHGEEWIWLRFRLEDGARSRVDRIWWEHGEISRYLQEPAGKDLRVVVQVPKAAVTKKTRVSLKVESGPVYRFALTPSTLTSFFKELFK